MEVKSIKFKGHSCFTKDWAGFDQIKPVNLIIGKNNSGKSRLIDFVETLSGITKTRRDLRFSGILDERSLRAAFDAARARDIPGNIWNDHGFLFLNTPVSWVRHADQADFDLLFPDDENLRQGPYGYQRVYDLRRERIRDICASATVPLHGKLMKRLHAERDLTPQNESPTLEIQPSGDGATNLVRRCLYSASLPHGRGLIETELLSALNEVFGGREVFTAIEAQQHDSGESNLGGRWEIILREQKKGRIPLRHSGSGLKTILLVLLRLLVEPRIEDKSKDRYVFLFEELENNLHPAMLRRLLSYIGEYAQKEGAHFFLTTHSGVALDVFGPCEYAQIVHVSHDGTSASTTTVGGHFDQHRIISDLGAKPSDLLQANCVVWLEGPSDRIYFNRWIDLVSDGKLREGRDYQCAYYGGSNLATTEFVEPDKHDEEFTNLLRLNLRIIVLCDSDRKAASGPGSDLKDRAARIKEELSLVPGGYLWISGTKEIENYWTQAAVSSGLASASRAPEQYEPIFPSAAKDGSSYLEKVVGRDSYQKVAFAAKIAPHMTLDDMKQRFDWASNMEAIAQRIRDWGT